MPLYTVSMGKRCRPRPNPIGFRTSIKARRRNGMLYRLRRYGLGVKFRPVGISIPTCADFSSYLWNFCPHPLNFKTYYCSRKTYVYCGYCLRVCKFDHHLFSTASKINYTRQRLCCRTPSFIDAFPHIGRRKSRSPIQKICKTAQKRKRISHRCR